MRRAFLALAWPPSASDAVIDQLRHRLRTEGGWFEAHRSVGLSVWLRTDAPLALRDLGAAGVVIGDLFAWPTAARGGAFPLGLAPAPPAETARTLCQGAWGRYVALLHDPRREQPAVFRDPSGLIGCAAWAFEAGVHVVASELTHAPPWLRPHRGFLNWDRIAAFLAAPAVAMTASLFDDVEVVTPGGLLPLAEGAAEHLVWNPADFATNRHCDLEAVAVQAVSLGEACVDALLSGHDRVLVELSGGLDSSIVSGLIGAAGHRDRVVEWLNYQHERPEADESHYARAVAERLGVRLATPTGWTVPIDEAALAEVAAGAWPSIGGADAGRDRDELARLQRTGATAIVSGQGGDGVFFQYPTALVLADALARDGLRVLATALPAAVARRTRQSVWAVLAQVRAVRRGAAKQPLMTSRLLSAGAAEIGGAAQHPWTRAARAAGLPAAKVLHVQGLAVTHLYGSHSRRYEAADIVLPLFAQPLVELLLGVAAPDLAGESYDRPFARRAFASRLPREVIERRSKGDMSTYYGKLVAASLPTLRLYLLDGCLAEAGLLDRRRLAATLDPQHLLRGGAGSAMDVVNAAAVEAWVRHWQTRVPDSLTASRRSAA